MIQKHTAILLHYGLRFEISNVLKSWTVPKEPRNKSSVRRLAVQVKDPSRSMRVFKGRILKRENMVLVTWRYGIKIHTNCGERKNVEIDDKKLTRIYVIVRFKGKHNLFFFKKDIGKSKLSFKLL